MATTSRVYDAASELTDQTDKTGSGATIANDTWTYEAGELTSETLNGGTPTSYTYDADGELTGDGSESETYDAEGNRTNTGYSTGTGNELQSDGTWNYSYDAAGNETYKVAISGGETWEYGYDGKNELVKAQLWASDPRLRHGQHAAHGVGLPVRRVGQPGGAGRLPHRHRLADGHAVRRGRLEPGAGRDNWQHAHQHLGRPQQQQRLAHALPPR